MADHVEIRSSMDMGSTIVGPGDNLQDVPGFFP